MNRTELTKKIADALQGDPAFDAVEVLDPDGEWGNEGVLSIVFRGYEEATFVSIHIDDGSDSQLINQTLLDELRALVADGTLIVLPSKVTATGLELDDGELEKMAERIQTSCGAGAAGNVMISMERASHEARGWDAAHDDAHDRGDLALAAALILVSLVDPDERGVAYPLESCDLARHVVEKYRNDPVHRLTIAGSLVAAEIDREIRRGA
jgi:hypothetical protein